MNREFRLLNMTIAERVVQTMKTATITAEGVDFEKRPQGSVVDLDLHDHR